MTNWLLSIVGIIFLGILLDIVYPNGRTNAFCKGIFGIFSVFVLVSPILKIDFNSVFNNESYVDVELSENITNAQKDYYKLKIESILKSHEIIGLDVELDGIMEDNCFNIENIYIDTTQIVLTENLTNINKYEVIREIILESIEIDSERIIIYG